MVTAYPVRGKAKSLEICRAFVEGSGGALALDPPDKLHSGAAFFYGVDASNAHLWDQVIAERREFYYCDNSYFDSARQSYFRVTRNRVQHSGFGNSDGIRFAGLGIPVEPMRENEAGCFLFCPQSDWFMRVIARYPGAAGMTDAWLEGHQRELKRSYPDRVQVVRHWSPDKKALSVTLPADLIRTYAVVTYSSAAAITALLAGVPAFCSDRCAAWPFSSATGVATANGHGSRLVRPSIDARRNWAGVLADNQWTLDEMRAGLAWEAIGG